MILRAGIIDIISGHTTHTTAVWEMPYVMPDSTWFSCCAPFAPFLFYVHYIGNNSGGISCYVG